MILVQVENVFFSNKGFVVLLHGPTDERTLPIFIGAQEAQAIVVQLEKVEIVRPLTHDLLKSVLDSIKCKILKVIVCNLYRAKLVFYCIFFKYLS